MIHIYCRKLKGIEKYLPTILKSRDNVIMSLLNFYLAYVVLSNWVMLYIKFFIICFLFKLTEAFPGIMKNPQVCVLVFFFLVGRGLNSGLYTWQSRYSVAWATLQPILLWLFWRWWSRAICSGLPWTVALPISASQVHIFNNYTRVHPFIIMEPFLKYWTFRWFSSFTIMKDKWKELYRRIFLYWELFRNFF
jgi:hypothetical protein